MILRIDLPIRSRNQFEGWHWRKKHQHSKLWERAIWAECRGKIPQAKEKVKIQITSFRTRLLDQDNLSGGCKGILDALKRLGMIVDDAPQWLEVSYHQERVVRWKVHTQIQLEENKVP